MVRDTLCVAFFNRYFQAVDTKLNLDALAKYMKENEPAICNVS